MSRRGESQPNFGVQTNRIDTFGGNMNQPNPGTFPGTQRPSYQNMMPSGNPNFAFPGAQPAGLPVQARFDYSAPTAPPRSPGGNMPPQQPGEPYRGGSNHDDEPPKKSRKKLAIALGAVGAVVAGGVIAYGPTIASELRDSSTTSSSSSNEGAGTGEINTSGTCASKGALLGEYVMRGSGEAIERYGIDGVLERNLSLVVKDDDGYTSIGVLPNDQYDTLLQSYHKVIEAYPERYRPGAVEEGQGYRSVQGVQSLVIQKRGEKTGSPDDGSLGDKEVLCVVGDGGDIDPA